mmetsp:Transcript_40032/g.119829  ORF Transcript_40032/g.119829 Transcript_40032/m.119829 type:complete len:209 (+) Transcript_40032:772-1398(+)
MSILPPLAMNSSAVGGAPMKMSVLLCWTSPPSHTSLGLSSFPWSISRQSSGGGGRSVGTMRSSMMPGELMYNVRAMPKRAPNLCSCPMLKPESDTMIDGLTVMRIRMRKIVSLGPSAFISSSTSFIVASDEALSPASWASPLAPRWTMEPMRMISCISSNIRVISSGLAVCTVTPSAMVGAVSVMQAKCTSYSRCWLNHSAILLRCTM